MACPDLITIPVIDEGNSATHLSHMITHDQIRAELIRQIDAGIVQQAAVARHLKIAPARVAEIRKGTRKIQPNEMPPLAELLKMVELETNRGDLSEGVSAIPNWGRVAQGVWMEESSFGVEYSDNFVSYDRFSGDGSAVDLFAVTPEGTSMNQRFPIGTKLICRRVPSDLGTFRTGSFVIVQRSAHDLHELTCKRVEIDDRGVFWLHSESDDPKFADPWRIGSPDENHHDDIEIRVIGKVIRAVQDFDNL